jgi:formylmethanofuran dehydrogenase subunit D
VEERKLKVYEAPGKSSRDIPCIMLQGRWLEKLGFNVGDSITVKEEEGTLVVELAEKGGEK